MFYKSQATCLRKGNRSCSLTARVSARVSVVLLTLLPRRSQRHVNLSLQEAPLQTMPQAPGGGGSTQRQGQGHSPNPHWPGAIHPARQNVTCLKDRRGSTANTAGLGYNQPLEDSPRLCPSCLLCTDLPAPARQPHATSRCERHQPPWPDSDNSRIFGAGAPVSRWLQE